MYRLATVVGLLVLVCVAHAQGVTGTLRVQGTVMVSIGGQFVRATNGQPVTAGMQLTVGEGASATVQYGPDCKRSYESAGTYTITPARCDSNDRKQDDKSRSEDSQQSQGQGDAGSAQQQAPGSSGSGAGAGTSAAGVAGSTGSLLGELAALAGTVAAGAASLDRKGGESTPDQPISR